METSFPRDPRFGSAANKDRWHIQRRGGAMGQEENVKCVQRLYEAFNRGDVGTILESLTDDVDWAAEAKSDAAPWFGPHLGKDAVPAFFAAFGGAMEVEEFDPHTFGSNEDSVFALVHCRARSRNTSRVCDMTLHHYFRFRDGKVCFYRGTEDTAQTLAVLA
jgi:ketosteroid isomerase-like protein